MSQSFAYTRTALYRLDTLQDALQAAGVAVETLYAVNEQSTDIRVVVAEGQAQAAVDAVVAAHDATQQSTDEVAWDADSVLLVQMRDTYQAMWDELQQGQTLLATAAWTPLTQAQKVERLRTIQQGQLAHEAQLLQAVRIIARRLGWISP